MSHLLRLLPLLLSFLLLSACKKQNDNAHTQNGAFVKATEQEGPNVARIVGSGELIIATISGPDTYFDYQGVGMGLQYALAEDFASSLGVAVRVELVNDTTAMLQKLEKGEVDLIAFQLPERYGQRKGLAIAGATNDRAGTGWGVLAEATDLIEALNLWYGDGVEPKIERRERERMQARHEVRRQVRAPFISREKGIISTYDPLFKEAAIATGWDWRLIAAQCYQESGFDPTAVSWAGAKGLMQIMPSTARHLGLPDDQMFAPRENMAAAARYIRELQRGFSSITDPEERVKFVLASYNGGRGHVDDARALTRKYGGDPNRWADVSIYVRGLSSPQYYRDPVVRHGYMIGSETAGYVSSIMNRWRQYGGHVSNLSAPRGNFSVGGSSTSGAPTRTPHKRNRYSREHRILSPEELSAS